MTATTNLRYYWGITLNGKPVMTGTFNQCWEHLTDTYSDKTLDQLRADGIRIARVK